MVLELKLDIGDKAERGVLKRIGGRSWEEWSLCCWQAAVSLSLSLQLYWSYNHWQWKRGGIFTNNCSKWFK